MNRRARTWLTPEAVAAYRDAWRDLAARALEPNIFTDPDFMLPAALHLARGRRPRFLLAWDPAMPGRLVGLCCVAPPVPGLPLSAWFHQQATAALPLLDAEQARSALANLLAQTGARFRPAGLLLYGIPADGATMRLIEAQPLWLNEMMAQRSRAVLRCRPEPLAGKAGKEFRRQARRLKDLGSVAVTSSATMAALESFLSLEAQGWKGRRRTALAQAPRRARFVREMAAELAAANRCRVFGLALDGRPIAMGLVLRSRQHAFFWKTAYDEAYSRFSPGAHLTEAIGQIQAGEADVGLTDSCAVPGHSMIDRLWPERMIVRDVFVTPTPALSQAQALALRAERARRTVRALAKGIVTRLRRPRHSPRHNPNMAGP